MPVYASLLSNVPVPEQNWQTKPNAPAIASVKVGEVCDSGYSQPNVVQDDSSKTIFGKWVDNLRQKLVQKRMQKLESIPEDKRTPAQQAEYEANQKSLNCVV